MKRYISLAAAAAVLTVSVTGCGSNDSSSTSKDLASFNAISAPVTDTDKMDIRTSTSVTYDDNTTGKIGFTKLISASDTNNGETFGLLKDSQDNEITFGDGMPFICDGANGNALGSGLDHSSIIEKNGRIFLVTQFECEVGAMYGMELAQDAKTGALSVKADTMQYISQKEGFGGWVHCAGVTTPWNSHLGSEEYEPNARTHVMDASTKLTGDKYFDEVTKYYWNDENDANKLADNNPYYYGYIPEVTVDANSDTPTYSYAKHFSMGRGAWELAYVMPDEKTAYLSDDGTNVGFYMYIADTAQKLSAGTLYAAKWVQTSGTGAGAANIQWIKLGHATDAEIKSIVSAKPEFSDIFATADVNADGTCNAGFTYVNTATGKECLKLNTGKEKEAAFLETRRYAAMLGATTEWRKEEGITFNKEANKLYVAMSQVAKGMSDDIGDIQVEENSCGAVYGMDVAAKVNDKDGNAITSAYVVKNTQAIIEGEPKTYDAASPYAAYTCSAEGIASPDNLTFITGTNLLVIGEDTDGHPNDFVWTYDLESKKLTRIVSTPYGSETTSPYWYDDINGFSYLTLVTQHPFGETDSGDLDYGLLEEATEQQKQSSVGVFGPVVK